MGRGGRLNYAPVETNGRAREVSLEPTKLATSARALVLVLSTGASTGRPRAYSTESQCHYKLVVLYYYYYYYY
jgi:hypothetical protein